MNMDVTIRKYEPVDKEIIENFFDVFLDFIASMDPLERLRRLPGFGQKYLQTTLRDVKRKNGAMYVAMKENHVIGFVVGVIIKQKTIERYECIPTTTGRVTELFVHDPYRGKNIGSLLLNKIESYFKTNDCNVIYIEVFEPNTRAHNFYQSFGYKDRRRDMIKQI
ncbi:MAG: GNAT family N-acetyltransferase [Candidatus Pacebacteria bacterium]|nr:GNAT family N-acetyltransferase [Candidatus Paceibacterota bacterium]